MRNIYLFLLIPTLFITSFATFAEYTNYTQQTEPVKQGSGNELRNQTSKEFDSKDKVKYKVEVVSYNSNWPKMFKDEAILLKQKLADNMVEIHHVGSTSVPGLNAKPIIDILAVVKDGKSSISTFESIGYEYKGEYNIPFHFSFSKKGATKVHLHVFEEGNPEVELNLLFRDYLRTHPDALKEYAELKAYLLTKETSYEKNNSKFKGYTLGKDAFIRKILQNAGFNKLRMMHCTHAEEWKMAKSFRQKYFDKIQCSDPYVKTFDNPEHVHLALYQGTKIIGYAHLQLLPEQEAAIQMFVIDEPFQNKNFEEQFLTFFEKWLKSKSYKCLHVATSPNMRDFYGKYGYKEMPFLYDEINKQKIDLRSISMGKIFN